MKREYLTSVLACTALVCAALAQAAGPADGASDKAWQRHTIDDSSRGADGVKILDVNGDGLPDIATGWEEGGVVRAYIHPGYGKVRGKWPAVTVGKVGSLEDAVFGDLDGDGSVDVISAAEGSARRISIHWAPKARAAYTDADKWAAAALPASLGVRWMFIVPIQLDGRNGLDFIAGSKGRGASIGWFQAPPDPRDVKAWKYHKLRDAGWIMSIIAADMNADGREDILFSDRYGKNRGVYWLENPGPGEAQARPWKIHAVGGADRECLFLDHADLDGDGRRDIVTTAKPRDLIFFRSKDAKGEAWEPRRIPLPAGAGTSKAVAVGDIDLDSRADLVFSCESATPPLSGVMWMSRTGPAATGKWAAHDVSGSEGVKFDLVVLTDLDNDGDLDILTCEERQNLGVFWYENPIRTANAPSSGQGPIIGSRQECPDPRGQASLSVACPRALYPGWSSTPHPATRGWPGRRATTAWPVLERPKPLGLRCHSSADARGMKWISTEARHGLRHALAVASWQAARRPAAHHAGPP